MFLTSVFKAHPTTTLLNTVRENTSFCDLLIGSIMAPTKYGLKFKSAQEESQFERCYVDLLTAIKASSPEFLKKIKQYFYHLYLTNTVREAAKKVLLFFIQKRHQNINTANVGKVSL